MAYDVLTTGYVSMDKIIKIRSAAKVGFTSIISNKDNVTIHYGGCSVNIAAALCELGKVALPIVRVGEDYEKIGFKNFLLSHHVPLEGVEKIDHEYTSCSYLVEDGEGNHITLFYPGAMDRKYFKKLNDALFSGVRLVVMTVGPYEENRAVYKQCRERQIPLVFSMKSDFDAFPKSFLWDLLSYSTIIFTNEAERKAIEDIFQIRITDLFNSGNADVMVTTCGAKGSEWYKKEQTSFSKGFVPAYPCKKIIDTSGSGDAYLAGFIYGYLENWDIHTSAEFGTILASFVLETEGCCERLPDFHQIMHRLKRYKQALIEGG